MRILIDIGHPGHVHLLRNTYHQLVENGHTIWVTVKNIPIAKTLLAKYNIPFIDIGRKRDSLLAKAITQIDYNFKVLQLVWKNKIEIGIGTSITLAHISKLSKMKSILLDDDDDEVQPLFVKYAHPFADTILSPESLVGHRNKKGTIFYSGFHELAYLHPNHFKLDSSVLTEVGLRTNDTFFIMRFNVFKAHHDVGVNGMSLVQKRKLIQLLEPHGKVFITAEREIEPELKKYQFPVSPEKAHSLMYYATMFLGDSQTMTSEAAILGTPAIRMNSLVGKIAYLEEEEHKYGLTYGFKPSHFEEMIVKINELLNIPNLKEEWNSRKQNLLNDKIDVSTFFAWFIENYPKSVQIMKENPGYQIRFK
jgi:predicted glycosyltransferase